ncbi:DUF6167 family protein [Nocardioides sp. MH1]|uniref:DUF6167 family protein n=1 Tax=Nocardioides sp. MH1 TaxID=3242490 RepID=UPI00352110F9
MRRGFWFAAGAAAGVYGMVKARRVAEVFTVDGLRDRAHAAGLGARMLRAEFEHGRTVTENDLRERYALAAEQQRELTSGTRPAIEGSDPNTGNERGDD